jgi:hypothetical protein
MSRIDGDVVLVGSVPFETAEDVFRACADGVGDLVSCLPDGEVGYRIEWINFLAAKLYSEHPDLETISRPRTPSGEDAWAPTGYEEHWLFRVRPGLDSIRFDDLGYARAARDSYATFRSLRDEGVIRPGVRFQVSLPPTEGAVRWFVTTHEDFVILCDAYREAMIREVATIQSDIPPEDLLIQWDVCFEVLAVATGDQREGLSPFDVPGDPFDRYLEDIMTLSEPIANDVPLGLHLCYGDLLHRHMVEPQDLGVCVRMANELVAAIPRLVDYVHMPVPRSRNDRSYFQPLEGLAIGDTKLYLGLIHHTGGVDAALNRLAAARRYASGFGIATECGLGRRPPESIPELLGIHRAVAEKLS